MTTEKRLIKIKDATAVYNGIALYMAENAYLNDTALDVLKMVAERLNKAPTVDAVEVVHGRWTIFDDGYGCELMSCSVCKSEFYDGDNDTVDHLHNYCPNCGAKMDGDGNG